MNKFNYPLLYCEAESLKGIYDNILELTRHDDWPKIGENNNPEAPSQLHIEKSSDGKYCCIAVFGMRSVGITHPHSNHDSQFLHIWSGGND